MVSCGDLIVRDMRGDCSETCKELMGLRRLWRRKPQDGGTHGLGNFSKSLEAVKSYVRFCGWAGCGAGLEKTCGVGST